jgi:hypothetical protein
MNKKFNVTFVIEVEEDGNILSLVEDAHAEDVYDLIHNTFHDIDDIHIDKLQVKERWL